MRECGNGVLAPVHQGQVESWRPYVTITPLSHYGTPKPLSPQQLSKNDVIFIITSSGKIGSAAKKITVELTNAVTAQYDVKAALSVNASTTAHSSAFISGFNHESNLAQNGWDTLEDEALYSGNGCDNSSKSDSTKETALPSPPTTPICTGYQATGYDEVIGESPTKAKYSGHTEADGHLPGIWLPATETYDPTSSAEVWGGDATKGWIDNTMTTFPTLAEMMKVNQADLDQILANANVTMVNPNDPPQGVTYIDNKGGQTYTVKSSTTGYGLMYVTGDLIMNSSVEFEGLIYVEGQVRLNSSVSILGAFAVKGEGPGNEPFMMNSSSTILYSAGTLEDKVGSAIGSATSGAGFTTLSWKEG